MRNIRKRFFDVGQINLLDEIIVDSFAGGGGASTGIELAAGRIVDVAINHDPDAILMHQTNHHIIRPAFGMWIRLRSAPGVRLDCCGPRRTVNTSAKRRAVNRWISISAAWPGLSCAGLEQSGRESSYWKM